MKLPTDLQILEAIYNEYYEPYSNFSKGEENGRDSKAYMPIDIDLIASKLNVDAGIIFGRLYNHLNKLHSYVNDDVQKSKCRFCAASGKRYSMHPLSYDVFCFSRPPIREK